MATGTILTNNARKICLNRTFKASPDYTAPSRFRVGVGTTTPTSADTSLGQRIPITGTETIDSMDATTGWSPNADCTLATDAVTKKEGTAALRFTKTGTASANANASKTTTNLNFTSKDLWCWIYVDDAATLAKFAVSNCLTLRYGSDATNYYQWQKNASFFSTGWNLIGPLNTGNATTVLSPDTANSDYALIQFTSVASSDDDYSKAVSAGYPSLDETNFISEVRTELTSTDAVGYSLTEFGLFNTDASPKLFSHAVHSPITKTTSVVVLYIEKDKVV
jgi:hypothetical protein